MQDENGQLTAGGKLLAGLGAGVCEAVLAVTPMETVKVKFINDQRSGNPQFKGFFHGVSAIIRQEGTYHLKNSIIFQPVQINKLFFVLNIRFHWCVQRCHCYNHETRFQSSHSILCNGNAQRYIQR